jgi:hypothetical protein
MLITVAPHRNTSTVLQDTVEDVRHRLSVVDTNTVTTVGFMSQQQDRLIGMDHNFSAQFADIQRRQEAQSEQLGSFNGQIAEVVPRVSERLDQSLDTLQASLRQQLRDTLQDEISSFIPAIEKAMSSMLRKAVKSDSPSESHSTTTFTQLNGQLGSKRMWMNVSTKEHQSVTSRSHDQSTQTSSPSYSNLRTSDNTSINPAVPRTPYKQACPPKNVSRYLSKWFWKELKLPGIGTFRIRYKRQLQRSEYFSNEVVATKLTFIPAPWSIFHSHIVEIELAIVHDVTKRRQFESILPRVEFYPVVPNDSPQALCAMTGDLDGLIELIRSGKASLRDRFSGGFSVLEVTPSCAHSMVRVLDLPC